jgi:hypothetical protein
MKMHELCDLWRNNGPFPKKLLMAEAFERVLLPHFILLPFAIVRQHAEIAGSPGF